MMDTVTARPAAGRRGAACVSLSRLSLLGLCLSGLAACGGQTQAPAPAAGGAAEPARVADDAGAAVEASAAALSAEQLQAIVDGLMRQGYGEQAYDAGKGCWRHRFDAGNDTIEYCMKPDAPQLVHGAAGTQLYLQAYSDPQAGTYALANPGLRGLFAATVSADGDWQALAATPAIDQGQAGDCACREARLVQVGPDRHGWLSTAGGVWQGVAVSRHELYVPVEGAFRNLSRIPRISEEAPEETIEIAIDATGAPVDGLYPLKATRHREGAGDESIVIAFDPGQQAYPWVH